MTSSSASGQHTIVTSEKGRYFNYVRFSLNNNFIVFYNNYTSHLAETEYQHNLNSLLVIINSLNLRNSFGISMHKVKYEYLRISHRPVYTMQAETFIFKLYIYILVYYASLKS